MYEIEHIKDENLLELSNSKINFHAKIHLNQGASLQELTLNNIQIIKEFEANSCEKTYASSILFPFTGRVKNGKYTYNNKNYQLEINNTETKSALHGLVYNKQFKLLNYNASDESQTIVLKYTEDKRTEGFPYKYSIALTYTFFKNYFELDINIKNNDDDPFPFSLGWHPYFYSKSIYDSKLLIESNKKAIFDKNMSLVKFSQNNYQSEFQIKNTKLDDCFEIVKSDVGFITRDYKINIASTLKENYVQVYTPPSEENHIAIEPLTAPPNSLNNKIGFQLLNPGENYSVCWKIKLNKN